ncbi:hypothetical protein MMC07_006052 [Pseudocyphellaria aurata]|nr:hypothetical protein [Pseudocyphellaria aurata]
MATELVEGQSLPSGPIPSSRFTDIAIEACDATFETVSSYSHSQTSSWNNSIINKILQALIAATSTSAQPPQYKFAVTSTIIQHITPAAPARDSATTDSASGAGDSGLLALPPSKAAVARRGMHSATGAYWDNHKDGMWSFKYDKSEEKGFDVVLSVVWIAMPSSS